jgi:hypothetical protein
MDDIDAARVVQVEVEPVDQHAELRGPARSFIAGAHGAAMVVGDFANRHLFGIAGAVDPIAAISEAAGPVTADMDEGCHEVAGARAADSTLGWHQVEMSQMLPETRIGLGLG